MKRLFFISITLLLFATSGYAQSKLDQIQKSGKLRFGMTGDFNPMNFIDPATNEYTGFDAEMAKELAKDMGVEIEFVKTDWKNLVSGISANKYDLSCSASLSPARAKVAGYTDSYTEYNTVPLVLKKNAGKFKDWSDFNNPNVTVAVTLGTVFEAQAREYFPKAKIVSVEAPARDFQNVLSGRSIVSLTSNVEAAQLAKNYPQLSVVKVSEARNRRPGAMLISRNDQVWINFVNHWIEFKKFEGFFDKLNQKWLNP